MKYIKYLVMIVVVIALGGWWMLSQRSAQAPEIAGQVPTGNTGEVLAQVTQATLALHNTQADCWVGYKDVAYDISAFLPRHPGSAAAIAPFCGTSEAFSKAFNGQHGTSKEGVLEKMGVVKGSLVQ